jgi:Homeodomain-like domain
MGWIRMSARDLKRIEVLIEVLVGRRTVVAAALVLGVSERQAYRLLARYQQEGGSCASCSFSMTSLPMQTKPDANRTTDNRKYMRNEHAAPKTNGCAACDKTARGIY